MIIKLMKLINSYQIKNKYYKIDKKQIMKI